MPGGLSKRTLFFREFLRNFHTTGAIAPSGRWLAAALARFVDQPGRSGRRILEVGPGTGAVTRRIAQAMRPEDRLDLVELNEQFVLRLRERLEHDPTFLPVAERTRVLHCDVEQLDEQAGYDVIVSGLPLNNFTGPVVEAILGRLLGLLEPGGTLSFFEYIGIRRAKGMLTGRTERDRLREITRIMGKAIDQHEFRRDSVWANLPPAWVHHLRVAG